MTTARPINPLFGIADALVADGIRGVIIGLSCGKDSLALLEVCADRFERIEAYYLYTTPNLSFHDSTLARCLKRHKGKLTVHRLPHWMLADFLRLGVLRTKRTDLVELPRLKIVDIEAEMRERTGLHWHLTGQKRTDSLQRAGMLTSCAGIDRKFGRAYPLMWWRDPFVYSFLKRRGVPLSPEYAVLKGSYGGDLAARTMVKIKAKFPEDYERIRERFPHVDSEIFRYNHFGAGSEQTPTVPGGADSPQSDQDGGLQPPHA